MAIDPDLVHALHLITEDRRRAAGGGEMMVIDGEALVDRADGSLSLVPPDTPTPFAVVTPFAPGPPITIGPLTRPCRNNYCMV